MPSFNIKYVSLFHVYCRTSFHLLATIKTDSCLDNNNSPLNNINCDKYGKKNVWGYVKNILDRNDSMLPSFNLNQCVGFTKTLTAVHPNCFIFYVGFHYLIVTNIIHKMKASGSPCPLVNGYCIFSC